MEEPLVIKALRDKRAEIHGQIAAYQAQIAQAKHDLERRAINLQHTLHP